MVGDDFDNDILGAYSIGLSSIYLMKDQDLSPFRKIKKISELKNIL